MNEFFESLTDSQLYFLTRYTMTPETPGDSEIDMESRALDLLSDLQNLCLQELRVRAIAQKMMLNMKSDGDVLDVEAL